MTVLVFQRLGVMPVSTDSCRHSCRRQFLGTGTEKVARNIVRPGNVPYAGSLELACHVIFGDDDLSRGGGGGGDGCQKLCALGCKVFAVEASVEFV